jgi:hypothetical protein
MHHWVVLACKDKSNYSKNYSWKIRPRISLPRGTKREIASAFYQLKLGHGYIKNYLHRLKHASNNRCKCGKTETAEHLLLSCPELSIARSKLKDIIRSKLSLPLLLQTTQGIINTLLFIKETGICTRRWHLNRCLEEEAAGVELSLRA